MRSPRPRVAGGAATLAAAGAAANAGAAGGASAAAADAGGGGAGKVFGRDGRGRQPDQQDQHARSQQQVGQGREAHPLLSSSSSASSSRCDRRSYSSRDS